MAARQTIAAGASRVQFAVAVFKLRAAFDEYPELVSAGSDGVFEALRHRVRLPWTDPQARLAAAEVMGRIDPIYTKFLLLGDLSSVGNGEFAARALIALSRLPEGARLPPLDRGELLQLVEGALRRAMDTLDECATDGAARTRATQRMVQCARFLSMTRTGAGLEIVVDVLGRAQGDEGRDQLLGMIDSLREEAMPSIQQLGELRARLLQAAPTPQDTAFADRILVTMEAVARSFGALPQIWRDAIIPPARQRQLCRWARERGFEGVANTLAPPGSD